MWSSLAADLAPLDPTMPWLTAPEVLLIVTIAPLALLSAQDNDTLEVFYPQALIRATRGSSVSLSCEIRYDFGRCGLLHAAWHRDDPLLELNDPDKYLTTVNETEYQGQKRRRQVVTEILRITAEDAGRFQCYARCPEETAMGHFIKIRVGG